MATNYTVKSGDTLSAIASRYGVTAQQIATANGISNINLIRVGQTLTIPSGGAGSVLTTLPPLTLPTVPQVQPITTTLPASSGSGSSWSQVFQTLTNGVLAYKQAETQQKLLQQQLQQQALSPIPAGQVLGTETPAAAAGESTKWILLAVCAVGGVFLLNQND